MVDLPFLSPALDDGGGSNLPSTAAASSSFKMELYVASISGASVLVTLNRSGILTTATTPMAAATTTTMKTTATVTLYTNHGMSLFNAGIQCDCDSSLTHVVFFSFTYTETRAATRILYARLLFVCCLLLTIKSYSYLIV